MGLSAPFCPLVNLLSPDQSGRWLEGAVGIENNTDRNLKDLEEMLGTSKALQRNNRECNGILIGPLKAPLFSALRLHRGVSRCSKDGGRLRAKFRGADGKPTNESLQKQESI